MWLITHRFDLLDGAEFLDLDPQFWEGFSDTHTELAGKRDRVSTPPAQVYRILNEAA